jgi:hypothetical protein
VIPAPRHAVRIPVGGGVPRVGLGGRVPQPRDRGRVRAGCLLRSGGTRAEEQRRGQRERRARSKKPPLVAARRVPSSPRTPELPAIRTARVAPFSCMLMLSFGPYGICPSLLFSLHGESSEFFRQLFWIFHQRSRWVLTGPDELALAIFFSLSGGAEHPTIATNAAYAWSRGRRITQTTYFLVTQIT